MDTSLDRFYTKAFELKLNLPEIFYSKISESVLNALSYMKKLKLLHRDIKPSNILLNSNGDVKVCDFGISFSFLKDIKWHTLELSSLTEPNRIKLSWNIELFELFGVFRTNSVWFGFDISEGSRISLYFV